MGSRQSTNICQILRPVRGNPSLRPPLYSPLSGQLPCLTLSPGTRKAETGRRTGASDDGRTWATPPFGYCSGHNSSITSLPRFFLRCKKESRVPEIMDISAARLSTGRPMGFPPHPRGWFSIVVYRKDFSCTRKINAPFDAFFAFMGN